MLRRLVVIETPWGELTGYLDPAVDDKLMAVSMAASMLGKGKVATWALIEMDAQPAAAANGPDPAGPHSRACVITTHDHGPDCNTNCPTCHGRPL